MIQNDGAFRRAQRPWMGWLWLAVGLLSFLFVAALMLLMLKGIGRWANGESVDLMGIAAIGGVALPFLGQLVAQGLQWMHTRSAEYREQTRAGVAPPAPFDSSPAEGRAGPGNTP